MKARGGVSAVAMVLGLTAALSVARAQGFECPPLTPVHQAADPASAFNVLILPDAFTIDEDKNELPAFRCAVDRLVRGLLTSQPFRNFGCRFNIYRMDTRSSYDDVLSYYSSPSCIAPDTDWPLGTHDCPGIQTGPGADEVMALDPRSRVCPETQGGTAYNMLLLPDPAGQSKIVEVASQCAPAGTSFQLVILVVDTEHPAGGALPATSPPISVVTLDDISTPAPFFKLGHEVAHAFMLLDEYTEGFNPDTTRVEYENGLNLWHACDDNDENDAADGPDGIPWKSGCDPQAGQQPQVRDCSNQLVDSPCRVVCAQGYGDDDCGISEATPWPTAGLYEGGFYQQRDYFRSAYECAMNQVGKPFCRACRCAAKEFLDSLGMAECPSWAPACGPQPDHEILIRDCENDYGGVPSMCDTWDLSPDLTLVEETGEASVVRACATNIGREAIPGDQKVTFRFMLAADLPTVEEIISGRADVPPIYETTRPVKELTGDVQVPSVWQIGERRCIDVKMTRPRPFRQVALEHPETRAVALMSMHRSLPSRVRHVREDHRLVQRLLMSMVSELQ
jgi:hypothetical protein